MRHGDVYVDHRNGSDPCGEEAFRDGKEAAKAGAEEVGHGSLDQGGSPRFAASDTRAHVSYRCQRLGLHIHAAGSKGNQSRFHVGLGGKDSNVLI